MKYKQGMDVWVVRGQDVAMSEGDTLGGRLGLGRELQEKERPELSQVAVHT